MTAPRLVAAGMALALTLAACGGDDPVAAPADEPVQTEPADPVDTAPSEPSDTATTDTAPTATATTPTTAAATTVPLEGPVSTISPDVPEEFLPGIRAIDIEGASLPPLETDDPTADPAVGMQVPVLVGVDYDDNPVRLDPATDGPTMVVVVAHWCPHCNAEIPVINELRDDDRYPGWLNIVAISTAARPDAPNFPPGDWLDEMDWTYPVIADGVDMERQAYIAADGYGVAGFPTIVLVNADGTVAARWSGESDAEEIINRINTYLSPF